MLLIALYRPPNGDTVVRPKWDFAQALKVFHSEFKAKNIAFHYAIDVSYEAEGIDYVIADLNRMKQGKCIALPPYLLENSVFQRMYVSVVGALPEARYPGTYAWRFMCKGLPPLVLKSIWSSRGCQN